MRAKIIVGMMILIGVGWWFYPNESPPLGYLGSAPNPEYLPGVRPTVECPIDTDFLSNADLIVDGKPIKASEVIFPRNKTLKVNAKLNLENVSPSANLIVVQMAVVSKSNNARGMLSESESTLFADSTSPQKDTYEIKIDKEWKTPDHAGEFNLILVFYVSMNGVRESPGRYAVVCPVKIE